MTVRFLDLGAVNAPLRADLDKAIGEVLDSGWYIRGSQLEQFEEEFATYVGAPHCVGTGNGLDALEMALRASGVSEGDEVIVPAHTFVATWLAVSRIGAVPVPVDATPTGFLMDAADLEGVRSPRTRAVVPVHLYGEPMDLGAVRAWAAQHRVAVVEDAAQAHGAARGATRVGTQGTCAWSFYPGKNLGALGDAGAVTTDDPEVAERVRLLGNYGSKTKYVHEQAGFNSRLDEVQAAALRVRLRALDGHNGRRQEIAERYANELPASLLPPRVEPGVTSAWHLYVVQHNQRAALQALLADDGIETQIHYPTAVHRQLAYQDSHGGLQLPRASHLADRVLSLPISPVMTDDEVAAVVAAARRAVDRLS